MIRIALLIGATAATAVWLVTRSSRANRADVWHKPTAQKVLEWFDNMEEDLNYLDAGWGEESR